MNSDTLFHLVPLSSTHFLGTIVPCENSNKEVRSSSQLFLVTKIMGKKLTQWPMYQFSVAIALVFITTHIALPAKFDTLAIVSIFLP